MSEQKKNQGEGNKDADRRYRKGAREFVKEEEVNKHAERAAEALEGDTRKDLEKAEEAGRSKAKEFDPQVKRGR